MYRESRVLVRLQGLSWCDPLSLRYKSKFTVEHLKNKIANQLRSLTKSPNLVVEIKSVQLYISTDTNRRDLQHNENDLLRDIFDQEYTMQECRFGYKSADVEFVRPPVPPPSDFEAYNLASRTNLLKWLARPLATEQAALSLRAREDRHPFQEGNGGRTFEELPHELLITCFEYLNFVDLVRMQQTNKAIYRLIQAMGPTDTGRNLFELKVLARSLKYLIAFRRQHWSDGIRTRLNTTSTWTFMLLPIYSRG